MQLGGHAKELGRQLLPSLYVKRGPVCASCEHHSYAHFLVGKKCFCDVRPLELAILFHMLSKFSFSQNRKYITFGLNQLQVIVIFKALDLFYPKVPFMC